MKKTVAVNAPSSRPSPDVLTAISKFTAYYAMLYVCRICDTHYPHLRPGLQGAVDRLSPARHSDDFTEVSWYGIPHTFTPTQARVVAALWKAWEHGTPALSTSYLTEEANRRTGKISDLFKDHPAYGAMIAMDGKGRFYLKPPEDLVMKITKWILRFFNRLLTRLGMFTFPVR